MKVKVGIADRGRVALSGAAAVVAVSLAWMIFGGASLPGGSGWQHLSTSRSETLETPGAEESNYESMTRALKALEEEAGKLEATLRSKRPRGTYIVVDRANNRIFLRKGEALLLDAPASTGSGSELRETGGQKRSWVFDTPAGRFSVLSERSDPVWTKPDWAFLESGEPIPSRISDRREYGTLGEYALDLGDGYMIHGTLYERLLGRSVTHGCVRVGRGALREIAARAGPGTQVFIF